MKTKIIATMGPAVESVEKIKQLITAGVSFFRLNLSHGTVSWNEGIIEKIRDNTDAEIILDTKGPEIRTCLMEHAVHVESGQELVITTSTYATKDFGRIKKIAVTYDAILTIVKPGDSIAIDSGKIMTEVLRISSDAIYTKVLTGGIITSTRHVNLPGVLIDLPILTEGDKLNLLMGCKYGVDKVAVSFVRGKKDVEDVRAFLTSNGSKAKIVSKIEHVAAMENLDEIIEVSDEIMVARGDLGIEIPWYSVAIAEELIIKKCKEKKCPVIVATQMMSSMQNNAIPTRAEVMDVTIAVQLGAGCVMLSEETTIGKFPIETVKSMKMIAEYAEEHNLIL